MTFSSVSLLSPSIGNIDPTSLPQSIPLENQPVGQEIDPSLFFRFKSEDQWRYFTTYELKATDATGLIYPHLLQGFTVPPLPLRIKDKIKAFLKEQLSLYGQRVGCPLHVKNITLYETFTALKTHIPDAEHSFIKLIGSRLLNFFDAEYITSIIHAFCVHIGFDLKATTPPFVTDYLTRKICNLAIDSDFKVMASSKEEGLALIYKTCEVFSRKLSQLQALNRDKIAKYLNKEYIQKKYQFNREFKAEDCDLLVQVLAVDIFSKVTNVEESKNHFYLRTIKDQLSGHEFDISYIIENSTHAIYHAHAIFILLDSLLIEEDQPIYPQSSLGHVLQAFFDLNAGLMRTEGRLHDPNFHYKRWISAKTLGLRCLELDVEEKLYQKILKLSLPFLNQLYPIDSSKKQEELVRYQANFFVDEILEAARVHHRESIAHVLAMTFNACATLTQMQTNLNQTITAIWSRVCNHIEELEDQNDTYFSLPPLLNYFKNILRDPDLSFPHLLDALQIAVYTMLNSHSKCQREGTCFTLTQDKDFKPTLEISFTDLASEEQFFFLKFEYAPEESLKRLQISPDDRYLGILEQILKLLTEKNLFYQIESSTLKNWIEPFQWQVLKEQALELYEHSSPSFQRLGLMLMRSLLSQQIDDELFLTVLIARLKDKVAYQLFNDQFFIPYLTEEKLKKAYESATGSSQEALVSYLSELLVVSRSSLRILLIRHLFGLNDTIPKLLFEKVIITACRVLCDTTDLESCFYLTSSCLKLADLSIEMRIKTFSMLVTQILKADQLLQNIYFSKALAELYTFVSITNHAMNLSFGKHLNLIKKTFETVLQKYSDAADILNHLKLFKWLYKNQLINLDILKSHFISYWNQKSLLTTSEKNGSFAEAHLFWQVAYHLNAWESASITQKVALFNVINFYSDDLPAALYDDPAFIHDWFTYTPIEGSNFSGFTFLEHFLKRLPRDRLSTTSFSQLAFKETSLYLSLCKSKTKRCWIRTQELFAWVLKQGFLEDISWEEECRQLLCYHALLEPDELLNFYANFCEKTSPIFNLKLLEQLSGHIKIERLLVFIEAEINRDSANSYFFPFYRKILSTLSKGTIEQHFSLVLHLFYLISQSHHFYISDLSILCKNLLEILLKQKSGMFQNEKSALFVENFIVKTQSFFLKTDKSHFDYISVCLTLLEFFVREGLIEKFIEQLQQKPFITLSPELISVYLMALKKCIEKQDYGQSFQFLFEILKDRSIYHFFENTAVTYQEMAIQILSILESLLLIKDLAVVESLISIIPLMQALEQKDQLNLKLWPKQMIKWMLSFQHKESIGLLAFQIARNFPHLSLDLIETLVVKTAKKFPEQGFALLLQTSKIVDATSISKVWILFLQKCSYVSSSLILDTKFYHDFMDYTELLPQEELKLQVKGLFMVAFAHSLFKSTAKASYKSQVADQFVKQIGLIELATCYSKPSHPMRRQMEIAFIQLLLTLNSEANSIKVISLFSDLFSESFNDINPKLAEKIYEVFYAFLSHKHFLDNDINISEQCQMIENFLKFHQRYYIPLLQKVTQKHPDKMNWLCYILTQLAKNNVNLSHQEQSQMLSTLRKLTKDPYLILAKDLKTILETASIARYVPRQELDIYLVRVKRAVRQYYIERAKYFMNKGAILLSVLGAVVMVYGLITMQFKVNHKRSDCS